MVEPYFDDGDVTIYCARCEDVLPTLAPDSVDLVLTDPPYSPACHAGARSVNNLDESFVSFDSIDFDTLSGCLTMTSRVVKRWVVATMDWHHIARLEQEPPPGLRFVRFGIWVKPNGAPQFTGDRPGPGWEGLAFLHREGERLRWSGGGRSSVFTCNRVDGQHPTEKPEKLMRQLIALFSEPGDTVLDLFGGGGTTARAAKDLGRRCILIEEKEQWCRVAVSRLAQQVLPLTA